MMRDGWVVYDDFRDDDTGRWEQRAVSDGRGTSHLLCDPTASVSVHAGVREVRIERFTRSFDGIQNLDNPKHLTVSTRTFEIPPGGVAEFSIDMAAEKLSDDDVDYRTGFATFNIIDVEHKLIFDAITTGHRIHGLYELQALPVGMVPQEESFLYVVDNAEIPVRAEAGSWHTYSVEIDVGASTLIARVDGHRLFHTASLPVTPRLVKLGMGILTLSPLAPDGSSTSLRGQGMVARWRRPSYRLAPPA